MRKNRGCEIGEHIATNRTVQSFVRVFSLSMANPDLSHTQQYCKKILSYYKLDSDYEFLSNLEIVYLTYARQPNYAAKGIKEAIGNGG